MKIDGLRRGVKRLRFVLSLAVLTILAGCKATGSGSPPSPHAIPLPMIEKSGGKAARSDNLPELDESSTLSDYLEYAALNNPGLEAAFNAWKAALEKAAYIGKLPDPRFNYAY
ncbi:MAG: hypothetical protein KAI64_00170, partial [Thermoplasmata archaeon]|nr:hypothetical protein [Thermoplasmata archaeon]